MNGRLRHFGLGPSKCLFFNLSLFSCILTVGRMVKKRMGRNGEAVTFNMEMGAGESGEDMAPLGSRTEG